MRFGHFDDKNREYVITRPDTPLPWINYLGCEAYFGIISNTAGGYSFYKDARLRRLTRYRYNNVPVDSNGRYLYVRDGENGHFWSPTWQPTRLPLENYTCRHGLGYTTIQSTFEGIETEIRYFVPIGQSLEIWQVHLTNHRQQAAKLSLFSSIEFCLWEAQDDTTNFQRNFSTGEVEIEDSIIYHKTEYRERRNHFAYFACSDPIMGYDTQRESFLGPYGSWERPKVVEQGQSKNSIAYGWSPIGSHHIQIDLQPNESHQVIFLLGYHENPQDDKFDPPGSSRINKRTVKPVIAQFLDATHVESAFRELKDYWESLLDIYQVETPDEHTNRMVNIWNAYQCMITFNMSRSASYFESGIGRGMGFRDSNQDLLGFVHMAPERAKERILDIAATQLENGGTYHQYQPLTKRGNNDVGGNFNDDPLWLIMGVSAYLKETGDFSILDEQVDYDNQPDKCAPLYEHLQRSLRYIIDRLGPHDLPLIGRADWNDCLNLNCFSDTPGQSFQTTTNKEGKVAESVFIAALYILAAKEMASIASHLSKNEEANGYLESAGKMEITLLAHGWDGKWFRRAYDDLGHVVGSVACTEGQIFIEPQGIAIMAGVGLQDGKAELTLASVKERLATPHGIILQQPAFSHYYLNLGEISSYPPGYKENAGIFCHTNPWIMIAEAILGHGDQAHDYYLRINPSARETISEIHRCEPYVYTQMIAGRDAPTYGEAKNSWLSGTAAWNYVAITQWILGIRASLDGLEISPVVPTGWQGFKVKRIFRGVTYHITVERKGPGNIISMWADGKPVSGIVAPKPTGEKKEIQILVHLA